MQRVVTAELDLELGSSIDMIFQIAVAQQVPLTAEQLTFTQGDRVYPRPRSSTSPAAGCTG